MIKLSIIPYLIKLIPINWFYSINLNIMLSNYYAAVKYSLNYYTQTMLD